MTFAESRMRARPTIALAAALLPAVVGCADGTAPPSVTSTVRLLVQPDRAVVASVGGRWQLTARLVDDAGATHTPDGPVTYRVRHATMATVDTSGRVTGGPQSGITHVVASTIFRGATLSDSAQVIVIAPDAARHRLSALPPRDTGSSP